MIANRTFAEVLEIGEQLQKCLGNEVFALLSSLGEMRATGKLSYPQEQLLRKFTLTTGIAITTADELIVVFETLLRKNMPRPPFDPNDPGTVERLQVCARLAACIGDDMYQRLLCSAKKLRKTGSLLFWQEELFRQFAAESQISISTAAEAVRLLDTAIGEIMSKPSPPMIRTSGAIGSFVRLCLHVQKGTRQNNGMPSNRNWKTITVNASWLTTPLCGKRRNGTTRRAS